MGEGSGMTAVVARELHKTYGRTVALDGLSFEIPSGTLTGFLGPNGAGKTTTFRALLGLTRLNSGTAEVLGMTVDRDLAGMLDAGIVGAVFGIGRSAAPLVAGWIDRPSRLIVVMERMADSMGVVTRATSTGLALVGVTGLTAMVLTWPG